MAADVSVTVGVDTHSEAHVGVALDRKWDGAWERWPSQTTKTATAKAAEMGSRVRGAGLRWGGRDGKLRCGALTIFEIERRAGDRGRSPESPAPPEAR